MSDKLTIDIPGSTLDSLKQLSDRSGYDFTELIRLGVAAAKVIIEAQEQEHIIIEATKDGRALQEIRFPQPQAINEFSRTLLTETYSLSLQRAISDLDPDFQAPNTPDAIDLLHASIFARGTTAGGKQLNTASKFEPAGPESPRR